MVTGTTFRNNFATGLASSFGASAGPGGEAGDGGNGGLGKPGGNGGDGGNAGSGAQGGDNGAGGFGIGGALFSTTPITLSDVTFANNGVGGGAGGSNTCTPGDFSCFGAAGGPGHGGNKGSGGPNWLANGNAPDGMDGADGSSGADGMEGAVGLGVAPDCLADGQLCTVPEPGAGLALAAIATLARAVAASAADRSTPPNRRVARAARPATAARAPTRSRGGPSAVAPAPNRGVSPRAQRDRPESGRPEGVASRAPRRATARRVHYRSARNHRVKGVPMRSQSAVPAARSDLRPCRAVLVIEDDDEMRRMLSSALARDGHPVRPFRDGMEALDYLDTLRIGPHWNDGDLGLIVSDVRMPGCSGLDLLDCLRTLDCDVPVILITAFGDAETHAQAQELGAELLLDKPFDINELRRAVRRSTRH